ncbi:MAG TPA: class I SAM-dependent methyltransferase [Actinophytocola sp.]|uniref:class I SAM-dependent methyltransferase n=1 Tax=Actinophytocola sp. TaxID=1872138 RepID=UPI002DDD215A|nr:class I SAM-dependent methyltransferase [Actinophytocola sp.]HEV2784067.1 class I SAM-dependent methyltransferase [Actinophytocola sp.]
MTQTEQSWQWYDDNAHIYEEMDPATLEFGRQLLAYADPPPGARLLDVGAGRGAVVRAAVDRGCVVTAVDAAPAMVARLRADFPTVTVSYMDAQRFDFPDACFDVVTAGFVLDLLPDREAAVAEVRRVLRPGGVFALSLPGPRPHRRRWQWLVDLAREFYPGAVPEDLDEQVDVNVAALLTTAGFVGWTRRDFELPVPIPDPAALWDLFAARLPTAVSAGWVDRLPPEREAEFRRRFLAGAERMHAGGGIALDRYVVLHRALAP